MDFLITRFSKLGNEGHTHTRSCIITIFYTFQFILTEKLIVQISLKK